MGWRTKAVFLVRLALILTSVDLSRLLLKDLGLPVVISAPSFVEMISALPGIMVSEVAGMVALPESDLKSVEVT